MSESDVVLRLLVATGLGLIIGTEREMAGRPAGLRTHALVALGSCSFTLVSALAFPPNDATRIASGIVTGLGFIGGGMILRQEGRGILGLTTAAGIWALGAVGMAIGAGLYLLGTATALLTGLILASERMFRLDEMVSGLVRDNPPDPDHDPHGPLFPR